MKGKKKSDEKRDGVLSWTVEGRGFFFGWNTYTGWNTYIQVRALGETVYV